MKVTVRFGAIRIVVPCNGEILVQDLIRESIRRYKNATGKNQDSWVTVHHLQTQSGILDPHDKLNDVVDDREQILALYEDCSGPDPGVPRGDGASGSGGSAGTGSPDIFTNNNNSIIIGGNQNSNNKYPDDNSTSHIDVGSNDHSIPPGLGLQVRRGSEPSLHQPDNSIDLTNSIGSTHSSQFPTSKRWSAAPVCRNDDHLMVSTNPASSVASKYNNNSSWRVQEEEPILENGGGSSFNRSGRLSMQFLGDGNGHKWLDAVEKLPSTINANNTKSLPRDIKRKEPLGQAYESIREKNGIMLLIVNENGCSLGISATPDAKNGGLYVHYVEPNSRADRGRLKKGDRIVEINGINLTQMSESSIEDILKKSLTASELRLRVIRHSSNNNNNTSWENGGGKSEQKLRPGNVEVAKVSPTRKIPGAQSMSSLQVANTRKLGHRIEITLRKGAHGLGFSVTTRDNPAGGHCPIYIKNILPKGAAVEDGRLRPGDRLLEVDGESMTGKTQTDVVGILRGTKADAIVTIVVSRQQELLMDEGKEREVTPNYCDNSQMEQTHPPKPPSPILPRRSSSSSKLATNNFGSGIATSASSTNINAKTHHTMHARSKSEPRDDREVFVFHIPVYDTEKAGLGVSVKGKTGPAGGSSSGHNNSNSDGDLGIFIKSVLHGGAASRDGRLKMNDQLLSVNNVTLLGQSNAQAMDTLRKAMLNTDRKYPGIITLTVARKLSMHNSSSDLSNKLNSSSNSEHQQSPQKSHSQKGSLKNVQAEPEMVIGGMGCKDILDRKDSINGSQRRWSNPVLDRLTGGTVNHSNSTNIIPNNFKISTNSKRCSPSSQMTSNGLRNESYYIATNAWSPQANLNNSHTILIEEDPEPSSPLHPRALILDPPTQHQHKPHHQKRPPPPPPKIHTPILSDATYSSQLSLETNDAFNRDAIGRRSISEKHHSALDAKETGTYQRNKKLREDRERAKMIAGSSSVESLTTNNFGRRMNSMKNFDKDIYQSAGHPMMLNGLDDEASDRLGELVGPSLGMKKSSSLESLQTMVQEIQMSGETRGPSSNRTPRGRSRDEHLRAAVEMEPPPVPAGSSKARKHWLLEEVPASKDENVFQSGRQSQFQASMNEGKAKHRQQTKKPGLLKGIGHMFRFGKHRKDVIVPTTTSVISDPGEGLYDTRKPTQDSEMLPPVVQNKNTLTRSAGNSYLQQQMAHMGPPSYQPPPHPIDKKSVIHHNDVFNHRYSHYVNYEELQQQINYKLTSQQSSQITDTTPNIIIPVSTTSTSTNSSSINNDCLSESTIEKMRRQVIYQREKVEEESRSHQHYHSQRSTRNSDYITNYHQRPISSYYEYETIQHGGGKSNGEMPKSSHTSNNNHWNPTLPMPPQQQHQPQQQIYATAHPNRDRGPYVTQISIRHRDKHHQHGQQQQVQPEKLQPSASTSNI